MGVTEYAGGFEFVETERAISATRVFHLDPDSSDTNVDIPRPGQEIEFPQQLTSVITPLPSTAGIICRQRSTKPLAGHPEKYEIVVTYSNEPIDGSVYNIAGEETPSTDVADLPMTLEYSGEYNNIDPTDSTSPWTWSNGGSTVTQPIGFRVNSSVLRIVRYIPDGTYTTFMGGVKACAGKVNSRANPFTEAIGGGRASWLFEGATTEVFYNSQNQKFWRAELQFSYRDPDGTDNNTDDDTLGNGWQKIMKLSGEWDIPMKADGTRLYALVDFEQLLTGAQDQ
jgi:hypothetical protein